MKHIKILLLTAFAVLFLTGEKADACQMTKASYFPQNFKPGTIWHLCSGMKIAFQTDGNLVVYNHLSEAIWNTETGGQGATYLAFQPDGNLVIYAGRKALWNSETAGHPGSHLAIQADGNIVIYSPKTNGPVFQSGTAVQTFVFHGAKADKQYCDNHVYVFPDGRWSAATKFSNGRRIDADTFISTIGLGLRYGNGEERSIRVHHSTRVKAAHRCKGSCEKIVTSSGSFAPATGGARRTSSVYLCSGTDVKIRKPAKTKTKKKVKPTPFAVVLDLTCAGGISTGSREVAYYSSKSCGDARKQLLNLAKQKDLCQEVQNNWRTTRKQIKDTNSCRW